MNRELLSTLIRVSNNSIVTNELALILNNKLTSEELREFIRWLRIVESSQQIKINNAKRKIF